MFTTRAPSFASTFASTTPDRRLAPHGRRLGLINDPTWHAFEARQARASLLRDLLETTRLRARRALVRTRRQTPGRCHQARRRNASSSAAPARTSHRGPPRSRRARPSAPPLAPTPAAPWLESPGRRRCWSPCPPPFETSGAPLKLKLSTVAISPSSNDLSIASRQAEAHTIPDWFDYTAVSGLSREMREKFTPHPPLAPSVRLAASPASLPLPSTSSTSSSSCKPASGRP